MSEHGDGGSPISAGPSPGRGAVGPLVGDQVVVEDIALLETADRNGRRKRSRHGPGESREQIHGRARTYLEGRPQAILPAAAVA